MVEKISMLDFIPNQVLCGKNQISYPLSIKEDYSVYLFLSYTTNQYNGGKRKHSLCLPKFISKNNETFEVLGLLQAEMGKTNNGCVTFCNHEYNLINKVMKWFEREFELMQTEWRWYIKVNINEPEDINYKEDIERKVIEYWLSKTKVNKEMMYPKVVTYVKHTKNKKLKFYDYGTLLIEYKSNLFSQIIKRFVNLMSLNMVNFEEDYIRSFMKGIIAGEGTVENYKPDKRYRVYISVTKEDEKDLYWICLKKLNIESKRYKGDKLIISKRENNVRLLKQRLMCLSHEKYNKFLTMMQQYPGIKEETGYFKGKKQNVWNKIPKEKVDQILELYNSGITKTKDIANKLGISQIKVQRVLKENNLGKRLVKTPEEKRKEIAEFAQENQKLNQKQIAEHFQVCESVVSRACIKYDVKRGNSAKCKIPEEKIQRIIEMYKENPAVKISDISEEIGVSDTVIQRVRKENNLTHLGYRHLIGCNNRGGKALINF